MTQELNELNSPIIAGFENDLSLEYSKLKTELGNQRRDSKILDILLDIIKVGHKHLNKIGSNDKLHEEDFAVLKERARSAFIVAVIFSYREKFYDNGKGMVSSNRVQFVKTFGGTAHNLTPDKMMSNLLNKFSPTSNNYRYLEEFSINIPKEIIVNDIRSWLECTDKKEKETLGKDVVKLINYLAENFPEVIDDSAKNTNHYIPREIINYDIKSWLECTDKKEKGERGKDIVNLINLLVKEFPKETENEVEALRYSLRTGICGIKIKYKDSDNHAKYKEMNIGDAMELHDLLGTATLPSTTTSLRPRIDIKQQPNGNGLGANA